MDEKQDSTTIFGTNQQAEATNPQATPVGEDQTKPSLPDELVEFVGEGKKYASIDVALKSIPHAQRHIQSLEEKLASSEEELGKRKSAEEVLAELRDSNQSTSQQPTASEGLSEDTVSKLVAENITKFEKMKSESANLAAVDAKMKELYGEKAGDVYDQRLSEVGLSNDYVKDIAKVSPSAFFKLFGIESKKATIQSKTASSVNTASISTGETSRKPRLGVGATTSDMLNLWRSVGSKQ